METYRRESLFPPKTRFMSEMLVHLIKALKSNTLIYIFLIPLFCFFFLQKILRKTQMHRQQEANHFLCVEWIYLAWNIQYSSKYWFSVEKPSITTDVKNHMPNRWLNFSYRTKNINQSRSTSIINWPTFYVFFLVAERYSVTSVHHLLVIFDFQSLEYTQNALILQYSSRKWHISRRFRPCDTLVLPSNFKWHFKSNLKTHR